MQEIMSGSPLAERLWLSEMPIGQAFLRHGSHVSMWLLLDWHITFDRYWAVIVPWNDPKGWTCMSNEMYDLVSAEELIAYERAADGLHLIAEITL